MAQPGPETSWEDLANLGWSKQQVYDTLNPLREYTMHGLDDLLLNEGIASNLPTYNVTKGLPSRIVGPVFNQVSETIPVVKFDNSNRSEPLTVVWTDKWSTKSTASLILTRGPSINLRWSVTIGSVAGSGFTISMSDDTSEIIEVESTDPIEQTFSITVPPGETLEILRTELTTKGQSVYVQKYGLKEGNDTIENPGAVIITTGDLYREHENWAYFANTYLNSPSSDLQFVGLS